MANTFKAAGETGWAQIVDGKDFSRFGVQLDCSMPVLLCIAAAAPAANSQDFYVPRPWGPQGINSG